MLVAIKDNARIDEIKRQTHEFEYSQWMRRLNPADFQRICDALNEYIDNQGGGEIITSSWVPGTDWTDSPFHPIYTAVGEDWEMARFFYGLIVWNVMMNRPETWSFGRYPKNDGDVIGMTYFRVEIAARQ